MSEEEEFEFDDEENEQIEEEGGEDEVQGDGEEDEYQNPEDAYRAAKEQISYDDSAALQELQSVYEYEGTSENLKAKVVRKLVIVACSFDDLEQILGYFNSMIHYADQNFITEDKLANTVEKIIDQMSNKELIGDFTNKVCETLDHTKHLEAYLPLALKQCEIEIKKGDLPHAEQILKTAEEFCPLDQIEQKLYVRRAAAKIFASQIQVAMIRRDYKAMGDAYTKFSKLQDIQLNPRYKGSVMFAKGHQLLNNHQFAEGKAAFYESFKLFNDIASDQRVQAIPFYGLCSLLTKSQVNPFSVGEVVKFSNHPLVAPIRQLTESYYSADYPEFIRLRPCVMTSFDNNEFYGSLLDEVSEIVLLQTIKKICEVYSRVELAYIAKQCEISPQKAQKAVVHLIRDKMLSGLIDDSTQTLVLEKEIHLSPYTPGLYPMLDAIEDTVDRTLKVLEPKPPMKEIEDD